MTPLYEESEIVKLIESESEIVVSQGMGSKKTGHNVSVMQHE